MTSVYTTAEVAQMFAVAPKTVTRWADLGWVTPMSTPGGHLSGSRARPSPS